MECDALRKQALLGEMLVGRGIISLDQLNDALAEQAITKKRLGQILVARKLITFDFLDTLLAQLELMEGEWENPLEDPKQALLGEMLVNRGIISADQLDVALAEQALTKKRLGQILIARKLVTFDRLDALLTEQESVECESNNSTETHVDKE